MSHTSVILKFSLKFRKIPKIRKEKEKNRRKLSNAQQSRNGGKKEGKSKPQERIWRRLKGRLKKRLK